MQGVPPDLRGAQNFLVFAHFPLDKYFSLWYTAKASLERTFAEGSFFEKIEKRLDNACSIDYTIKVASREAAIGH